MSGMSDKTLGQIGYDAYGAHAEWKAFDGRPMPRWDDPLRADVKEKWEVAAAAIGDQAVKDYIAGRADAVKNGTIFPEDVLKIFGLDLDEARALMRQLYSNNGLSLIREDDGRGAEESAKKLWALLGC